MSARNSRADRPRTPLQRPGLQRQHFPPFPQCSHLRSDVPACRRGPCPRGPWAPAPPRRPPRTAPAPRTARRAVRRPASWPHFLLGGSTGVQQSRAPRGGVASQAPPHVEVGVVRSTLHCAARPAGRCTDARAARVPGRYLYFFRIVHLHHKQFAVKRREPSGHLTKPERNRAFRTLLDETRTQSEV